MQINLFADVPEKTGEAYFSKLREYPVKLGGFHATIIRLCVEDDAFFKKILEAAIEKKIDTV